MREIDPVGDFRVRETAARRLLKRMPLLEEGTGVTKPGRFRRTDTEERVRPRVVRKDGLEKWRRAFASGDSEALTAELAKNDPRWGEGSN